MAVWPLYPHESKCLREVVAEKDELTVLGNSWKFLFTFHYIMSLKRE